jgi:hypothetical protein
MKDELMKLLPDLKQAVEQGITYAGDLFDRAVVYYKIVTYIGLSISSIVLISCIIYCVNTYRWVNKRDEMGIEVNNLDDRAGVIFIVVFLLIISITLTPFFICDLIKLNIIPELYILQLLN